jgi:F420-dependent NADP oxidoreductase-like protein
MEIGTIGAGAFAQAFAKRALKAGHKVKLSNSRGPDSLREIVDQLGPGAMAATKEEAAACEMVLLAVPWDNVPETFAGLPKWKNQILIDGTNPFHGEAGNFTPADVGNLSTSQLVAALAAGARVVKALNARRSQAPWTGDVRGVGESKRGRLRDPAKVSCGHGLGLALAHRGVSGRRDPGQVHAYFQGSSTADRRAGIRVVATCEKGP